MPFIVTSGYDEHEESKTTCQTKEEVEQYVQQTMMNEADDIVADLFNSGNWTESDNAGGTHWWSVERVDDDGKPVFDPNQEFLVSQMHISRELIAGTLNDYLHMLADGDEETVEKSLFERDDPRLTDDVCREYAKATGLIDDMWSDSEREEHIDATYALNEKTCRDLGIDIDRLQEV